jgi:hypothetical protein
MCCFSQPVRFVGGTKIFARGLPDGRQALVYAMEIEIDSELAMVLPIPVPPGSPDDAVSFVSLEGYDRFFDDLAAAFPAVYAAAPQAKGGFARGGPAAPKLVVHDVGLFEASFVPTRADFDRLDQRFRMPEKVWDELAVVRDMGFAVFRLKPKKKGLFGLGGGGRQRIHPMAFVFPRRDPHALFFPTLHVHDGHVPATAHFDHALYCQPDALLGALLAWTPSTEPLGHSMDTEKARGLIAAGEPGRQLAIWGAQPNVDCVLRAPDGVQLADVMGAGATHRYELRLHAAFGAASPDARRQAWHHTARERAPQLVSALRDGVSELCARQHAAWSLAALDPTLPPHFLNGRQLWSGTTYMDGRPAEAGGPGRVVMQVFTERVEPQLIELAFRRLPDPQQVNVIFDALAALLDRAAA